LTEPADGGAYDESGGLSSPLIFWRFSSSLGPHAANSIAKTVIETSNVRLPPFPSKVALFSTVGNAASIMIGFKISQPLPDTMHAAEGR
jgi:hypothetical protein